MRAPPRPSSVSGRESRTAEIRAHLRRRSGDSVQTQRPLRSRRVINQTVRRAGPGGGTCCWPRPARAGDLPWRDSQRATSRAGEAGGAWGQSPGLGRRTPARLRESPA